MNMRTGSEDITRMAAGYYVLLLCLLVESAASSYLGTWSAWSYYGACSTTCGVGTMERTHQCQGGTSCPGNVKETAGCNTGGCPTGGTWSDWGTWHPCTIASLQSRFRHCQMGPKCGGRGTDIRACQAPTMAPVNWESWNQWTTCSASCGGGTAERTRHCPSSGNTCAPGGLDKTMGWCNAGPCFVGTWSAWSYYGACSTTCGVGTMERTRQCQGGTGCPGNVKETAGCNTGVCPTVSVWGAWSVWSACSVTCGTGFHIRTRTCSSGNTCQGSSHGQGLCGTQSCVVATTQHTAVSGWAAWDSWHHCSATCGQGEQIRFRVCLTGTSCTGNVFDKQSCNTNVACPGSTQATLTASTTMTGAVTTWSTWTTSSCSVTCGFGQQSRFRVCSTGINTDCTGSASSNSICLPTNCP